MTVPNNLIPLIEAILFASDEPVNIKQIAKALEVDDELVRESILSFQRELQDDPNRGICIYNVASGYELRTKPEYKDVLEKLFNASNAYKLSHAALETLAIVAYRQPIGRTEISKIRGVNSDSAIRTLLNRDLIEKVEGDSDENFFGQRFATTDNFLIQAGLSDLSKLPDLDQFVPNPEEIEKLENLLRVDFE